MQSGVARALCSCYPFHGSPDITIGATPVVLLEDKEENGSEQAVEADAVVENALKQLNQTDVMPNKLGEVLANMHIALVKKILQVFVVEGRRHTIECHGSGLLLHPRIGGILCKITVQEGGTQPFANQY